jgi:hypothetical protein
MSCDVDNCPRIQCFSKKMLDAEYWFSIYCGLCSSKRKELLVGSVGVEPENKKGKP